MAGWPRGGWASRRDGKGEAGKAVLVTGGAGYVGSVIVEDLRARAVEVLVLDDLSRGHRDAVDPTIPFYRGNVGDPVLAARIAGEHRIDACVHCAAFAYVGESMIRPAQYFENNLAQTLAGLEALVAAGTKRIVYSSFCAVYGEPARAPIGEDTPQRPTNPYGWSKSFIERVLKCYDRAYGLRFVALRYFNAAGATERLGEHHVPESHLIPNVLAVAQGRQPCVPVYGRKHPTADGTAVRDYIHVSDLSAAHLLALEYLRAGGRSQLVNLGNGKGFSVLEVIEVAHRVTGRSIQTRIEAARPGDSPSLVADASRARALFGWKPAIQDLTAIIASAWIW
jgi:UDP-glucose 4-epimerase